MQQLLHLLRITLMHCYKILRRSSFAQQQQWQSHQLHGTVMIGMVLQRNEKIFWTASKSRVTTLLSLEEIYMIVGHGLSTVLMMVLLRQSILVPRCDFSWLGTIPFW